MARSYWNGTLVVALTLPALAWGQPPQAAALMPSGAPATAASAVAPATAPACGENLISVQEAGKPAQKCRVLKCWCLQDGTPARDVQDVATGEVMTILECLPVCMGGTPCYPVVNAPEPKPSGGSANAIYHWGPSRQRPSGVPMPEGTMVVAPPQKSESMVVAPPKPEPMVVSPPKSGSMVVSQPSSDPMVVSQPTPKPESDGLFNRWLHRDKVVQAPAAPQVPTAPPAQVVGTAPPSSMMPMAGRRPPTDASLVKSSKGSTEAGSSKPTLPGEACCEKTGDGHGDATASAAKPFKGVQHSVVKGTESAQPTDWRRSWGKPDAQPAAAPVVDQRPKTLPPASAVTKASDSSKTPPPPQWPEDTAKRPAPPPPVKTVAAPKAPTPPKPEASKPMQTVQVDLPHADTKKPDPLYKPEAYSRRPLDEQPEPVKAVEAKKAPAAPVAPAVPVAKKKEEPAAPVAKAAPVIKKEEAPATGVASTQQRLPMGAGSVLAAYSENPGQVIYLPVPIVTLPGSTAPRQMAPPPQPPQSQQSEQQVNAFSPAPQPGNPNGEALASNAFATPLTPAPPAYPQPNVMYPPLIGGPMSPQAMAAAAYARPLPGQMYSGPQPPNPVAQAGYNPNAMPGYPRPMMPGYPNPVMPANYPPQMPMGGYGPMAPAGYMPPMLPNYPQPQPAAVQGQASTVSAQNTQQLMLTLKDALYPSHREWAAEALATVDWRTQPQVVDALIMSAKEDPAATVRAGSVRALAKMNVNSAAVVSALQGLKGDADPRVRQDVEQALTGLGASPGTTGQTVQPAGGVMPK